MKSKKDKHWTVVLVTELATTDALGRMSLKGRKEKQFKGKGPFVGNYLKIDMLVKEGDLERRTPAIKV